MPWNIIDIKKKKKKIFDIIDTRQWTGLLLVQAPTNNQSFSQLDPYEPTKIWINLKNVQENTFRNIQTFCPHEQWLNMNLNI